jgi:hypothetical protein
MVISWLDEQLLDFQVEICFMKLFNLVLVGHIAESDTQHKMPCVRALLRGSAANFTTKTPSDATRHSALHTE